MALNIGHVVNLMAKILHKKTFQIFNQLLKNVHIFYIISYIGKRSEKFKSVLSEAGYNINFRTNNI